MSAGSFATASVMLCPSLWRELARAPGDALVPGLAERRAGVTELRIDWARVEYLDLVVGEALVGNLVHLEWVPVRGGDA